MNRTWKALASITVAAALVIAPLATTGAIADDTPPDETVAAAEAAAPVEEAVPQAAPEVAPAEVAAPVEEAAPVEVAAPVEAAPVEVAAPVESAAPVEEAAPLVAPSTAATPTPNEGVCTGVHITPLGSVTSFVYTAPAGYRISGICVKAGSIIQGDGPEYTTFSPPVSSVTIFHSSGKDISHYSVSLVQIPYYEPEEVTPTLEWTPPTCDEDGTVIPGNDYGYHWELVPNEDGSTTYTAVPDEGYEFPEGAQTEWIVPDLTQLPADSDECYSPTEVTPMLEYTPPTCDSDGEVTFMTEDGVDWVLSMVEPDGDTTYTASPEVGFVFPEGAQTVWVVPNLDQLDPNDPECVEVYPVPALFNAEPEPPTCETAGAFLTDFLGEPISSEGGVSVYEFENVFVHVDRSTPGEVTLRIEAKEGFVLDGLSDAWEVSDDGTVAERVIILEPQLDDPVLCPLVITPVPAAPEFVDECGVINDGYTVPEDTELFVYEVTDSGTGTVVVDAVLVNPADEFPVGAVTHWEFTFTDEECPLIPGGIASQCVGSVPYLGYSFTLPEGFVADSDTPLTITFVHPTDPSQDYTVTNQPLTGAVLWPGARATAPQQWPGWVQLADGTYVETTGNYAWTRPSVTVRFEVNPSYETTVNYPAESALCANPVNTPPTPSLAVTGAPDMGPWGIAGLAFMMGGLALLYTRRLVRR